MVYVPPEGSPSENKDVFTELENSLLLLEHEKVCGSVSLGIIMLGLVLWTALSQMDLIMILTRCIKFLKMPLVVTKSRVHYEKDITGHGY